MLTDIQIAQQAELRPITEIAAKLGFSADEIIRMIVEEVRGRRGGAPRAAQAASASPSVVSWSVRAKAASPFSAAYAASSEGVKVPSEQAECV